MYQISISPLNLQKLYPLRISRGVSTGSQNLLLSISDGQFTGVGEAAPGALTGAADYDLCKAQIERFLDAVDLPQLSIHDAWQQARDLQIAPCAYAAVDMALWDLKAKRAGVPLYDLLGLARRCVATSVTIGIETPEVVRERVPEILQRTGAHYLKVKLGSPEGVDADQAMFSAVLQATQKFNVGIRVDANGGWDSATAKSMMRWLADRGTEYIEQPLHHDNNAELAGLYKDRCLPIFIDESCRTSADVAANAEWVDGVNLKLMKCAGITEALRIVASARAHGLQTMIGCMGESSIAIAAGASIGALFDYIDLDSQLNLSPDPTAGVDLIDGVVLPRERHGHGGELLA